MKKAITILVSVLLMMSVLSLTAFAAEDDEMVPVVVQVPEGWDAPHAWAWADDGTNAFAAWPGEEMEPLAEGWYYIYVPGFVQNVIVNANQGTDAAAQTDGIVVEAGKEVWITVAEDATASVSYEAQLRGGNSRVCGEIRRPRLRSPVLENRKPVGMVGARRHQRF